MLIGSWGVGVSQRMIFVRDWSEFEEQGVAVTPMLRTWESSRSLTIRSACLQSSLGICECKYITCALR